MLVSILSAVHNEAQYIEAMIQSVIDQDHQDWELLFVDDGSTDSTPDMIRRACSQDNRIRLVAACERQGKVSAFNRAAEESRGDLVVLLAGDDLLPQSSLSDRVALFRSEPLGRPCVGYFKFATISSDPRMHGMVLPRGRGASRSGISLALTKELARKVFPIPSDLLSEDVWLPFAASDLAERVLESRAIVGFYRIHEGNSHPRGLPFTEMSKAMAGRHRAWALLLDSDLVLSPSSRRRLLLLIRAEEYRMSRQAFRILRMSGLPLLDKAALAAMASPGLYVIRTKFYKLLSGRRGM